MESRAGVTIAPLVTIAAILIDWPRALAGLAFGAIGHYLPYGTIVIPVGSAIIAAVLEFLYPIIGRTQEPSLRSLVIGFFVVAGTASSLHVVMRDLENWL
jgi:hypothetical protein